MCFAQGPPLVLLDDEPIATSGRRTSRGFRWNTGTEEEQMSRRLKLAEAVRTTKAYFCPHGKTEERWRAVVQEVKGENDTSELFFALKRNLPGSNSWETLKTEWSRIFKEWQTRDTNGALTSGAAESYTELDQICQNIASLIKDAKEQAKNGHRRSSYIAPAQAEIDAQINGDLQGRARVVVRNMSAEMEEARANGEIGQVKLIHRCLERRTRAPLPRAAYVAEVQGITRVI